MWNINVMGYICIYRPIYIVNAGKVGLFCNHGYKTALIGLSWRGRLAAAYLP